MDLSPPAPAATTPRTAPAALLRAQNSVAALPRGRPDVLAFVTDNFHLKKQLELYMEPPAPRPHVALRFVLALRKLLL